MARHTARIGTLSIPNGQQNSQALNALLLGRTGLGMPVGITIYGPAAETGTITVEVQPLGDSTFRTLQSAGADVTVGATKAVVVTPTPFGTLRLHSSGAEGAQRDFFVDAQIDVP